MRFHFRTICYIEEKKPYLLTLAVISMLLDHTAIYFLPQYDFLRVLGRFAFPLFLFFASFHRDERQFNWDIILAAFFLSLYQFFALGTIFPLNILFPIFFLKAYFPYTNLPHWVLTPLVALCIFFHYYTGSIFEYGTLCVAYYAIGAAVHSRYSAFLFFIASVYLSIYSMLALDTVHYLPYLILMFAFFTYFLYSSINLNRVFRSPSLHAYCRKIRSSLLSIYFFHTILFISLAKLLGTVS